MSKTTPTGETRAATPPGETAARDGQPDLRETDWKGLYQLGLLSLISLAALSVLPVVHYYYGRDGLFRLYEYGVVTVVAAGLITRLLFRYPVNKLHLSLRQSLVATALVAIYATAWRSMAPAGWELPSVTSAISIPFFGFVATKFVYLAASNWVYFPENLLALKTTGKEEKLLVPPRLAPRQHLLVAVIMLAIGGVLRLAFGPLHFLVTLVWIGVAARWHGIAIERTAVWELGKGIKLLDKCWLWANGPLRLVEVTGETRLAPHERLEADWPPLTWWPLIPDEHVATLQALLDTKQESAEEGAT